MKEGFNMNIVLEDGTVLELRPDLHLIYIHPTGKHAPGSYRVNMRLKMVDFIEGDQF